MLSRRILLLAVAMLVIAALTDPADTVLHLKVPAFALAMAVWLYRRGPSRDTVSTGVWSAVLAAGVVIPLAWTVLGIFHESVHSGDAPFAMMKSFLFLMMLPLLVSEDVDLVSLMVRLGILIAVFTLAMVAVNFFSPLLFIGLNEFTAEKKIAIVTSARDLFGIGVGQFYYKTSPLMIFPFTYYCNRLLRRGGPVMGPFLLSLVYAAAMVCSGTRANVLAILLVFGVLALHRIRQSGGLAMAFLAGTLTAGLLLGAIIPRFADRQEESNVIKTRHVESYIEEFESHPTALLWGEGANSAFFSTGFNDWTTITEVTYLELVRVFGLPLALLFIAGLLHIAYSLFARGHWRLGLAYVAYLAISASNELLISSTGFLAICAVWKEVVRSSTSQSAFYLKDFEEIASGRDTRPLPVRVPVAS